MTEFTTDVQVRFRDLDAYGHVNNAVYVTYLEQARVEYLRTVLGAGIGELDVVLASLSVDYRKPVTDADSVEVAIDVPELGRSSVPMEYEIRTGGSVVAVAESVLVTYDFESDSSKPIPEEWREEIAASHGL
ncbi:Acyl-CoA thioesterase FadM [Halalkaliarchaeum sp. AArc-CO]|uniref:acyl-CoA thioesterase n=1 Tax=unclassified Halalkaliarchaeum TaxID=2678344 RepID=UPI00217D14D2|nr:MULTISPECIES: thioesterase family protein [unclassified Halalkaliarchaeum]MDR5674401.1 thioesterase family protein [Halalkaliarchaeum sp. AArc-GB]UWG52216.1 Acyl-CoA thioesterase FadM [Halalkaliarchaeum sp. AArc-CO]